MIIHSIKFSDLLNEIKEEAQHEGPAAVQELQELTDYYKDQRCLIQEFFKREQEKPLHLRSNSCMICCRCPNCNNIKL